MFGVHGKTSSTTESRDMMPFQSEVRSIDTRGSLNNALPLCRKLLLTAVMMGNDVCVSFIHLYEVPLLKILGVPTTYVSLFPVVSGPVAVVLLNVLGRFSDKGPRHRQRKIAVLAFVSAILATAMVLLIVANLLLLIQEDCKMIRQIGSSAANFSSAIKTVTLQKYSYFPNAVTSRNYSLDNETGIQCNRTSALDSADRELSMLQTAALCIVGFCLMDFGTDLNQAATRACVLACSPVEDHTSILLVSLVMAALGGCINHCLGLVDLPGVVGITSGNRLAVQTTLQLIICEIILVTCLASTVVTAFSNIKRLHGSTHPEATHKEIQKKEHSYGTFESDRQRNTSDRGNNSEFECHGSIMSQCVVFEETNSSEQNLITANLSEESISTEKSLTALSSREPNVILSPCPLTQQSQDDLHCETSYCFNAPTVTQVEDSDRGSLLKVAEDCTSKKHRNNFIVACISLYFSASVIFAYNLYAPDFLGKAVMGGDSSAKEGSAELRAYEDGVALAAGGLLVCVVCYFGISTVHKRLIEFWGLKVDYCLSHALMATAILSLTLSKQAAVYYAANVLYGFQRAAMLSVPYIVANTYIQKLQESSDTGSTSSGRMMAMMTSMVPLNYCSIYVISGPLVTLTQQDGAPLLLASVSTYLAALVFWFYSS